MASDMQNPALGKRGARGIDLKPGSSIACEDATPHLSLQVATLTRRYGLTVSVAAAVAELAFATRRRA